MADPFQPIEQSLPPLAELLQIVAQITVESIPDWGIERGWEFDEENLDGVSPGWNVSGEAIESLVDDERSKAGEEIREVTDQLLEDEDISRWEDAIVVILFGLLLGAYGLGKGGREQISASDVAFLQSRLRNQFTFLRGFGEAILQATLTPNQIRARAGYYASDSAIGYTEGFRSGYQAAGWRWELNVLSAVEHCPGCLDAAAQGWQPIGTLPPLGTRECRFNEQCSWQFSDSIERPADRVRLRSFVMDKLGWL